MRTGRLQYKEAECIGKFGYGNGRTGRDYCNAVCPAREHCWQETWDKAEHYCSTKVSDRYFKIRARLARKGIKDAAKRASRILVRNGFPDPALEVVTKNTGLGVKDRYSGMPEDYRRIAGASWVYQGSVIGYYPLA